MSTIRIKRPTMVRTRMPKRREIAGPFPQISYPPFSFRPHLPPFSDSQNNVLSIHGIRGVKQALCLLCKTMRNADISDTHEPLMEQLEELILRLTDSLTEYNTSKLAMHRVEAQWLVYIACQIDSNFRPLLSNSSLDLDAMPLTIKEVLELWNTKGIISYKGTMSLMMPRQ